jgi:hypothetical protein
MGALGSKAVSGVMAIGNVCRAVREYQLLIRSSWPNSILNERRRGKKHKVQGVDHIPILESAFLFRHGLVPR